MPDGLKDDDMETQLTLDADQYIPYPLDEVAIDFEIQGPTAGRDGSVDVLLAACRRETIDSRVEAIEQAGLIPRVIDVEAYAMERVFELLKKVPFLGDIPYLGNFFRSTTTKTSKTETLIFITPRILSEALVD